jgi:hypothetical protein
MDQFHSYFHPENILKLLCKYRMKYAMKKHKLHLLADISSSEKTIRSVQDQCNVPIDLSSILPSRRNWYRPNRKERERFNDSQKLQQYALYKTISTIHIKAKDKTYAPPEWYNELNQFIKEIQTRANNPRSNTIKSPSPFPIKKENKKECKECRPLALYDLQDRIIISLTAKYFTELFDEYFSDSSYAFRAVRLDEEKRIALTHHDTIERILKFKADNVGKDIFAAECDIKKFFDCVNHDLVIDVLDKFILKNAIILNVNAKEIFIQYLKSYSFSRDVYPLQYTTHFTEFKIEGGYYKWIHEELDAEFYQLHNGLELKDVNIGVPQGGALSCFISNLFLHSVDEIVNSGTDSNLLYLRFCDDMVILHTDISQCKAALERYEAGIKSLKLQIHTPELITEYSKKFWNTKSKSPYKWDSTISHKANVPWLSFVGYQIKFDGSIRVRKNSVRKEMKKQSEECDKVLRSLNHSSPKGDINDVSKKSRRQQLFALENRLISMSVGRVKLYDKFIDQSLCWTNGFKAINTNVTSVKQLKLLDKNRSKQLFKVKKKLFGLVKPSENPEVEKGKFYFGSPYSYHNFLSVRASLKDE